MDEKIIEKVMAGLCGMKSDKGINKTVEDLRRKYGVKKNRTWQEIQADHVDRYNKSKGDLDQEDGYHCEACNDKGFYQKIVNDQVYTCHCKCEDVRRSIRNMKRSGLEKVIKDYTFDKYEVTTEWQRELKKVAMEYVRNNVDNWFFIGGNPGSGKTHLCTAICRDFLATGHVVHYMLWKEVSTKLKSLVNDTEKYAMEIKALKKVEILYIDDFFKPTKDREGNILPPTSADVALAFEILDYRKNEGLKTIISSERYITEIINIDEALGSRIIEMSGKYYNNIKRGTEKNYRMRNINNFL